MTLAEFLLARIAEDEATAKACVGPDWETGLPVTLHPNPDTYRTVTRRVGHVCGSIIAADAAHIARHDPARVLAECEAKRRIVERYQVAVLRLEHGQGDRAVEGIRANESRAALRLLAAPYADRSDYPQEWTP